MFYWPSLLCLAFLLGRFLHMFVKSLKICLGREPPTVSTNDKHGVCPDRSGLHSSAVREVLSVLLPSCVRKLGPREQYGISQGRAASLQQSQDWSPESVTAEAFSSPRCLLSNSLRHYRRKLHYTWRKHYYEENIYIPLKFISLNTAK